MTVEIDVSKRPLGSFFGNGFRSVECTRCRRPGLLIQKAPRVFAHSFTLRVAEATKDTVCDWHDVCGEKRLKDDAIRD